MRRGYSPSAALRARASIGYGFEAMVTSRTCRVHDQTAGSTNRRCRTLRLPARAHRRALELLLNAFERLGLSVGWLRETLLEEAERSAGKEAVAAETCDESRVEALETPRRHNPVAEEPTKPPVSPSWAEEGSQS